MPLYTKDGKLFVDSSKLAVDGACCICDTGPTQPRMVRGGWYHFLVLDDHGGVEVFIGSNEASKVSMFNYSNCIPDEEDPYCVDQCVPVQAPAGHPLAVPSTVYSSTNTSGKKVKDICCGAYHCIVRHTDNSITAWGLNSMGQCNVPTTLGNGTHSKVKKIVGLHAGYSTSAVSFNDGTVLAWGDPAVCDIVNTWTDLMMSPVNNLTVGTGEASTDNVDPAKPQYAKPRYSAAYNTDADLVTWNLQSDSQFYWHNQADNAHCQPFFDLGCEVDPFVPLEFSETVQGETQLPTVQTTFPYFDAQYQVSGVCDIDKVTLTTDNQKAAWKDALAAKWRNRIFQAHNNAVNPNEGPEVTRSCCDLEVKKDFATAMRRTGQIITTRNDNKHSSCPSGMYCRDCSADNQQQVSDGLLIGPGDSCPPTVGDSCAGYPNCPCCTDNYYTGCPKCNGQICNSDKRFYLASFGYDSSCIQDSPNPSIQLFYEGVGCMSANPNIESYFFNPNWANPYNGMTGRWTAAEQVRDSSHTGGPKPSANVTSANLGHNWGWTSLGRVDQVTSSATPLQKCHISHGNQTECNALCKDFPSTYAAGEINPSGTAAWYYPQQMFMQGFVAGSNTTCWVNTMQRLDNATWIDPCTMCGGTAACNDIQTAMPNGGELGYGCIYSGNEYTGTQSSLNSSFDKYNYYNFYRGGVGLSRSPCEGPEHLFQLGGYHSPSKPWGPFHIAVWNGVGADQNQIYPDCACCPGTILNAPPNVARIPNPVSSIIQVSGDPALDQVLGTYLGMPQEANMFCTQDLNGTGTVCQNNCERLFADGDDPVWSTFGAPFCKYHPPHSVASTRMAFAMVRADHRTTSGSPPVRTDPLGRCLQYPNVDPSQYVPCNLAAGDCTDDSCATPRTDMMLHIWGSLFDPCPPWPRICDCSFQPTTTGTLLDDYTTPCDVDHPEGSSNTDSGALKYPYWTKTPTGTGRSPKKGSWSGTTWVQGSTDETAGPKTRYCPDCSTYEQQWALDTIY